MNALDIEVEVQGFAYDEAAWRTVAAQAHFLGNVFNKCFEGQSGHLFWETASNVDTLIRIIEHVNKTQRYLRPDEIHEAKIADELTR